MSTEYVTKQDLKDEFTIQLARFELELMPKIEAMMYRVVKEQSMQFERNVGAVVEHFLAKVQTLAEGVMMQIESVERLRIDNSKDHEWYESRLSKLEALKQLKRR